MLYAESAQCVDHFHQEYRRLVLAHHPSLISSMSSQPLRLRTLMTFSLRGETRHSHVDSETESNPRSATSPRNEDRATAVHGEDDLRSCVVISHTTMESHGVESHDVVSHGVVSHGVVSNGGDLEEIESGGKHEGERSRGGGGGGRRRVGEGERRGRDGERGG